MKSLPNILLVVLDSVRARNTSVYGHKHSTTPFLEEFADVATVYEQARSPSIHSLASHTSIFTGYHTEEHNVVQYTDRLKKGSTIWNELRDEYDYNTGLFTPNAVLTRTAGLSQDFDFKTGPRKRVPFQSALSPRKVRGGISKIGYLRRTLREENSIRSIINGLWHLFVDAPNENANLYNEKFLEWVDKQDSPWAACINYMDAHAPYIPQPQHNIWGDEHLIRIHNQVDRGWQGYGFIKDNSWWKWEALENLYDGCIHQLDNALRNLVEQLNSRNQFDNTLVIITSDHGEAFGEVSQVEPNTRLIGHGAGIHEVQTHVPLLVKYPGQKVPERVSKVSSLTLFPQAVHDVLNGPKKSLGFLPDGPVLSSTYRVNESSWDIPEDFPDPSRYFGPWQSVYEDAGNSVKKYSKRHKSEAVIISIDAQTSYRINEKIDDRVSKHFGHLEQANVKDESTDRKRIDPSAENRLRELGYIS